MSFRLFSQNWLGGEKSKKNHIRFSKRKLVLDRNKKLKFSSLRESLQKTDSQLKKGYTDFTFRFKKEDFMD